MKLYRLYASASAILLIASPVVHGVDFTVQAVVLEGDEVPGVGLITSIDNIAVNNNGQWLVEADTDNPDTNADSVLLMDGVLILREGDPLSAPEGATLGSFDSVTLNGRGNRGHNFFLDGTSGTDDDSGVFWNDELIFQEGDEAPLFTPGTPFVGFFDVKINGDNDLLVTASVDDPNIESSVDRALYLVKLNSTGRVLDVRLVVAEGDILPGQTEAVADIGTGPHATAFNSLHPNDDVLFFADLSGDTTRDGVIYMQDSYNLDYILIAQEGDPSPVTGRSWSSLSSPRLDLTNWRCYVFSGTLDGDTDTNLLLVKNGGKFRQEGDTMEAIDGVALTSFGSGPLEINSPRVEVLWYGKWNNPDTTMDEGLFLDDTLLIQEGVTILEGSPVDTIRGVEDGYHMSEVGDYIIAELVLSDGREGAFLMTRDPPPP
ncbi:MAG: hypothetical protein IID37_06435, partial [Planctomycetes bacterium]|nr:hypothetical protein [Planctomycetota bacterium]